MECNKDEAIRAKKVSESKMENNDFEGARKIALKAQKLYPELDNMTQLLSICDVHCSAQRRVVGTEKDWYGILQVENLSDESTIKKQYRRLALILHPDKNQFPGAEAAFKLISEAHAVLSDAAKKSLYDSKIRVSVRSAPVRPPHMKANSNLNSDANGFSNPNPHQATGATFSVKQGGFWTCCPFCMMKYQYSRDFVNKPLRCRTCSKPFIGYEISAHGAPLGSKLGQPSVHVPSKPVLSQPAVFQQKVVLNQGNFKMGSQNDKGYPASHAGSHGIPGRKAVHQEPGVPMESSSTGARKRKECGKSDDATNGGSVDLKNKSKKSSRQPVEESSESFDSSSDSDLKDETSRENWGAPANDLNSGAGCAHLQRRSSRVKQNVQYNESDEDGKESKESRKTHVMTDNGAETVEIGSDYDRDSCSEDDSDGNRYDCPDPEFYDFEKERDPNNFDVDQIWACYDDVDSMPRFYAKVTKATASPFEVSFRWLDHVPKDEDHKNWVDEELPVGCGTFKLGKAGKTSAVDTFSHRMMPFKQDKKKGRYMFYPRQGEVWALYKDWDMSWSLSPENHLEFKYEIVEVVSNYVPDAGIEVSYLDKVVGFVSLFHRTGRRESDSFLIGPNELYKFSHRVPSFKMTGSEKEGVPVGSFELDPASLPLNPDGLHFPGKAKAESGNLDPNQ